MKLVRAIVATPRGKILIAVVGLIVGWQIWLSATAAGKIADGIPEDRRRVDVLVTLNFPPERFHIQKFQQLGRVSGTSGNSVQVRGVNQADITALARPFWVKRVEPLS